jgi:hypothetical protein
MQQVWVGSQNRQFCFGDYLADGRWLDAAPPPEGSRVALHTEGWLLSLEYQVPAPVVLEAAAQPPSLGRDWRLMAHAPIETATGRLGLVDVPMGPIGELIQIPVGVHECFAYRRIIDPTKKPLAVPPHQRGSSGESSWSSEKKAHRASRAGPRANVWTLVKPGPDTTPPSVSRSICPPVSLLTTFDIWSRCSRARRLAAGYGL